MFRDETNTWKKVHCVEWLQPCIGSWLWVLFYTTWVYGFVASYCSHLFCILDNVERLTESLESTVIATDHLIPEHKVLVCFIFVLSLLHISNTIFSADKITFSQDISEPFTQPFMKKHEASSGVIGYKIIWSHSFSKFVLISNLSICLMLLRPLGSTWPQKIETSRRFFLKSVRCITLKKLAELTRCKQSQVRFRFKVTKTQLFEWQL